MSRIPLTHASSKSLALNASGPLIWTACAATSAHFNSPSAQSQGGGGLAQLAARLPWDLAPQQLQAGDLSVLPPEDASAIARAAAEPSLVEVAAGLGIAPVVLVIALLALTLGARNRTAARTARSILGKVPSA